MQTEPLRRKSPARSAGRRQRARTDDRSADARRAQIIEVAARYFAEFGFEATTVRQIADEVGILPGSLYHHFETKEEILHEVIKGPLSEITQQNAMVSHIAADAEHRLIANIIMRFHYYIADGAAHAIIRKDGNFFRRNKDFGYVQNARHLSFQISETIMRDGMEVGLVRKGIDTYLMIGTIARMLTSAAAWIGSGDIYSTDIPDTYDVDRIIDFHLDAILRMIRPPERLEDPIPRRRCEELALEILATSPDITPPPGLLR
jgi:TetR/AcrR family transcriptional regulator, cholesterol catabolism regulator